MRIAVLLALLSFLGCSGENRETTKMSLDELSQQMGIVLPPGTELLAVSGENGIDDAVFAKVALEADSLTSFLSRLQLSEPDFSEDKRYLLGPDDGSWDPRRAASLPTAQVERPNGAFLNVGLDRSNPARPIVFLMWHET